MTTWRKMRGPIVAALAALAVVVPAHAQVSTRQIGVTFHDGAPDVSFSAADFADDAVRTRLSRGLMQTIVMRTYAYGSDRSTPIAVTVRSCHVVYDIWAARYDVDIRTEHDDRSRTIDTLDGVVDACLVADHVTVGDAAAWRARQGEHVTFAVVVELNPVTPDMVQRIRGWLARPEGGGSRDEAFFGSFVSLFVFTRQVGAAERTFGFQTPEYQVP
jgi:hypothetical protein